jgi:predicted nucleic acid-binding protein
MHAIDTSLLYALFNARDRWHAEAKDLVQQHRPILVPPGILQETLDLLRLRHGGKAAAAALAWLQGNAQLVLDADGAGRSHAMAVRAFSDPSSRPGEMSFADVWCATHAADRTVPLLSKDKDQLRFHEAWQRRGK